MTKQNTSHQHLHTDCSESSPSTIEVVVGYLRKGFSVIPLKAGTKEPALPSWKEYQTRQPTFEEVTNWWQSNPEANVGLVCGKESDAIALDVDDLEKFEAVRKERGWKIPRTAMVITPRGCHIYFRYPKGYTVRRHYREDFGAELRGDGCYVVAPPSVVNGHRYKWMCDGDRELSVFTAELAEPPIELLEAFGVPKETEQPESTIVNATLQRKNGNQRKEYLIPAIVALLQPYWVEGQRHDLSLALSGALAKAGWSWSDAEQLLNAIVEKAEDNELKDRLRALKDTFEKAQSQLDSIAGWSKLRELLPETICHALSALINSSQNGDYSAFMEIKRSKRPCTDLGNAERLVCLYGDYIRFVPQSGWFVWDGKRWARDPDGHRVTKLAEETVRQIYREAAEANTSDERNRLAKWAIVSESRQRISAMIELAAPMCLAQPDEFDADDWLLNLANGVLNLRTLEFMPHDPNLKLTKLTPVVYDPIADCPKWKAFLQRIFNDNEQVIRFVQRAIGYSLTGLTCEQCLFFLYGTGANGKSTFLEVIRALFGDYAATAEFSTFVADRKSSVRNDIARLHNARLVTAIEVGEGKRFAEELIKTLTGGDIIAARFLYREFFEFRPRFKVWLAANYKPEIRGTDWAIWRRIRLIPFTVTIPPEEQIPDLADQLKSELSGILNWALEGLRDWLANGLQPPPEVVEATEAYRAEMDIVGLFIQDACILDPKAVTPSKTLYDAFREWCAENGYEPFGQNAFGRRLTTKGFTHTLTYMNGRRCRCWIGIRLRSENDPQPDLLLPDTPDANGTDGTDGTHFSKTCPIYSDAS